MRRAGDGACELNWLMKLPYKCGQGSDGGESSGYVPLMVAGRRCRSFPLPDGTPRAGRPPDVNLALGE